MLDGTVEMDETYVGGRRDGQQDRSGRGDNKEIVIGIRQRGGELRFFHAKDVKSGTLAKYIRENVSADVDVMVTDEFACLPQGVWRVRSTRDGQPCGKEYVRSERRHSHEHRRIRVLAFQARHHGNVAQDQRQAPPGLP